MYARGRSSIAVNLPVAFAVFVMTIWVCLVAFGVGFSIYQAGKLFNG